MANKMLHTKAEVLKKNISVEEGIIDAVVGSTNVLDRTGDVIDQDGWELKNYQENPVILWGHNVHEERPPIGKALKIWMEGKQARSKKLMFKVKFDLQDSFAAEIFRKVKEGFLNTVSVGFMPLEWEELDKSDPWAGRKYTKQELLELSFVPVPANPEAIVALRSMSEKDKRFAPVELEGLYLEEKEIPADEVEKPYPNEHSCRLRSPGDFQDGSFRSTSRNHKGKKYRVIMGRLKGEDTMTEQSYRYPKNTWDAGSAKSHCTSHDGTFEAASQEEAPKGEIKLDEELVTDKPVEEKKVVEEKVVVEEKLSESKPTKVSNKEVKKVVEPEETPKDSGTPKEAGQDNIGIISKKVIPFKDLGTLPETESWDGPGETARADVADLKLICAWYDADKADNKGSYKLPHHKAEGHKCVWRGTAAAMAALLGARGGVNIPDADKKGVFNHLKRHYAQFDKEAPDFKMVEEQVLVGLEEEICVLTLDREEKYVVRLIKKLISQQKQNRVDRPRNITNKQIVQALEVLNLALGQVLQK